MKDNFLEVKREVGSACINRRDFPRLIVNIQVELVRKVPDKEPIMISGNALNINQRGLLCTLDQSLSTSTKADIKVKLPHPFGHIRGQGRVIWGIEKEKDKFYCGIYFLQFNTASDLNVLKQFINSNYSRERISDRRKIENKQGISVKDMDSGRIERRLSKGIFKKCIKYSRVDNLESQNKFFYLREISSSSSARIKVKGREMVMLGSNNYLGLTTHPKVKEAAIKAIEKYGTGSGGVRVLSGTLDLHNKLEQKLAKFKGGQDCVVFPTGYSTNLGTIAGLIDRDDFVIIDTKSHTSIIDGSKLCNGQVSFYKHNDMEDLEKELKKTGWTANKLIVTDGVFSMDGDIAKLDKIYNLAQQYNAALMIDDAHGTGVLGKNGRGTAELFGLERKIDLIMGTLSKALGGIGGFVVGSSKIISFLKYTSRVFVFSTSLPPSVSAAVIAGIEVIEEEPDLRKHLWENIQYMKKGLREMGFDIGNTESAIIPIMLRDEIKVYKMVGMLEELGIFVNPVAYPAVRKKESRIRVSVMATHSYSDLEKALEAFKKVGKKMRIT